MISHQVAKSQTEVTAFKNAFGGWSYGWQKSLDIVTMIGFHVMAPIPELEVMFLLLWRMAMALYILPMVKKPNRFPVMNQTRRKVLTLMNWNKTTNENTQEIPLSIKSNSSGLMMISYMDREWKPK